MIQHPLPDPPVQVRPSMLSLPFNLIVKKVNIHTSSLLRVLLLENEKFVDQCQEALKIKLFLR